MQKCRYCGEKFSPNIIGFHEKRCKENPENKTLEDITKLNVKDAGTLVTDCEDVSVLKAWLEQEGAGENRESLLKKIDSRINALTE